MAQGYAAALPLGVPEQRLEVHAHDPRIRHANGIHVGVLTGPGDQIGGGGGGDDQFPRSFKRSSGG